MINKKPRQRGQATIELAFVLPLIVILIIGIQWTGTGIATDVNVTAAAQAGAQAAADALDKVDEALNCTAPASDACMTAAEQTMQQMVDAALPCTAGTAFSPPCQQAVSYLANNVALKGATFCATFITTGCAIPPTICCTPTSFINLVSSCRDDDSCKTAVDNLADALIEGGLGCDQLYYNCEYPLLPKVCAPRGPCNPPPDCALPACSRPVMTELIGGFAQLGLACAAVRRSLQLPDTRALCIPDPAYPNDPVLASTTVRGMPYLYTQCIPTGAIPSRLFLQTLCRNQTLEVLLTVQYTPVGESPITATASAVPVAQFSS
jgi:Flp pilus assembly protein TadG